jgi:hypothetical protein
MSDKIFDDIRKERLRQDTLKAEGRFRYTLADEPGLDEAEKLIALLEEVAEVGKAVLGERHIVPEAGDKRKELIHVAAVAVAWIEALDSWKGSYERRSS